MRREILTYLALNSAPNLNASLVLDNMVNDFEKIGDYVKDIADLASTYPAKIPEKYIGEVMEMKKSLNELFDLTKEAVFNSDEKKAKKAIKKYIDLKNKVKEIKMKTFKSKDFSAKEAATIISIFGFFRRIGLHLQNTCSSVLVPFPKMGYGLRKVDE